MVDEEGSQVVSAESDSDVDQVPKPVDHNRFGIGVESFDEVTLLACLLA